ncbi:hypothetical protein OH76DRAFT_1359217 [Lentinus brumalis]|uniref:Uncharacterized protein n=1 Tax=Lentinus brumalis TaxID=2498619 RepID=A0A371CWW4_9APHY|nr:hypothetical protein OH76DRAFT_1359217 [Polyporus brumalis]
MHPGYKLQHFRNVGWPEEWIQVAETMIRDEWETYYRPKAGAVPAIVDTNMKKMFSSAKPTTSGHADPLDLYLNSPVVPQVDDPLKYWNAHLASPSEAPLVHFTLDFLSVPGKSQPRHLAPV